MGILDIFRRKPVAAIASRAAPAPQKRNFTAARPDRLAAGFTNVGYNRSANEEIRWDLRGLIAHSRQQAQNNDYMKHFLGLVRRNVVGPHGIRFQNAAMNSNGKPDKGANDAIEGAFAEWGKAFNCSLDGVLSWRATQEVVVEAVARDGGSLIRLFRGKEFGPFGFQLQVLEIDYLDFLKNELLSNGGSVKMGIEFDADGKRAAYHLFTRHPGEYMPGRPLERIRVPADQIILVMRADRPGAVLGVPWAYTALRRLNMLHGYEEAAITAARVGASQMGFYVPQSNAEELDPALADGQEQVDTSHLVKDVTPGMIETLPMGYDFKNSDPKYPTGEMEPFMRVVLQGAAAGLGLSYVTLSNDLSRTNFSSLRTGKQDERDEWQCLQQWLIESLHDKVMAEWLPMAFLAGKMGGLPFSKIDKFMQPRWRPRGWAYVQPGDESTANQRDMAAMLKSPQQIIAERGGEMEEVFAEIAAAKALAKDYGLEFNPMAPGHETPAVMDAGEAPPTPSGADGAEPAKPQKPKGKQE